MPWHAPLQLSWAVTPVHKSSQKASQCGSGEWTHPELCEGLFPEHSQFYFGSACHAHGSVTGTAAHSEQHLFTGTAAHSEQHSLVQQRTLSNIHWRETESVGPVHRSSYDSYIWLELQICLDLFLHSRSCSRSERQQWHRAPGILSH